jgi:hypothetical protein
MGDAGPGWGTRDLGRGNVERGEALSVGLVRLARGG